MHYNQLSQTDPLLSDSPAAEFLGATRGSLRQSRYTGVLFGRPAPLFLKMGRSVRYKLSELIKFRDQFSEFSNTAEVNHLQREYRESSKPNSPREAVMSPRETKFDWEDADSILQFVEAIDGQIRLRTRMVCIAEPENAAFTPPVNISNGKIFASSIRTPVIGHLSGILENHFYLLTGKLYDEIADAINHLQNTADSAESEIEYDD